MKKLARKHGKKMGGSTLDQQAKPYKDVIFRRALAEMGETDLQLTLDQVQKEDPRAAAMLAYMADPAHAKKTLPRIAQMSGFTRRELVMLYQEHQTDVLRVKIARELPSLADDLNADAKSMVSICGACRGKGTVMSKPGEDPLAGAMEEPCVECSGKGTIRTPGQTEARKSILAITGLVKPSSGPNMNVNLGLAGHADGFDSLISQANDIVNGPRIVQTTAEAVDADA